MCHLSLLGCPSRNSLPQSTRNPPAIHAQANPTLRPRPSPPPCSVFRLGFFSSRNSNPQKAKAETPDTLTPPARSGLLFLPLPCGVFGGVTIHPQSTRNPPAIHAQANPTLRPRPSPPPCSVFRLGFFSSRNSNPQKAKAETPNTLTPPARSGLLFPPHPFGLFGGVGGVNTNSGAIGIVSTRGNVSFLPQSHPSWL